MVMDVVKSPVFKDFMRTAAREIARGMFKSAAADPPAEPAARRASRAAHPWARLARRARSPPRRGDGRR